MLSYAAVRRSRVYVDTREGTLEEVGDIAIPLARGVIGEADIVGDLTQLARGERDGRPTRSPCSRTVAAATKTSQPPS